MFRPNVAPVLSAQVYVNLVKALVLLAVAAALPASRSRAANGGNWLNTTNTNNDWSSGTNWSSGAAPLSTSPTTFNLNNTYTATLSTASSASSFNVTAGNVNLATAGNTLSLASQLNVASSASQTATLNITGGGIVNVLGTAAANYVGGATASNGTLDVTGTGSQLNSTGAIFAGDVGSGSILVDNGGALSAGTIFLALNSGSQAGMIVGGSAGGGSVNITNSLSVGGGNANGGIATLSINAGRRSHRRRNHQNLEHQLRHQL